MGGGSNDDIKASTYFMAGSPDCDLELTGAEDPIVLNAVISALPPSQAYKEGLHRLF